MKEKKKKCTLALKSEKVYSHMNISDIHMDYTCKCSNVFSSRFMTQDEQGLSSKPLC